MKASCRRFPSRVHLFRLTGGGFGGAIVALVSLSLIDDIAKTVEAEYFERTGHNGKAYQCLIGDGALVHE